MPVIEDVQETAPLLGRERLQAPIIQDQKLDARQRLEQAAVTSITAREQQYRTTVEAMVKDRTIVAASLLAKGAGNKTLADASRPDDQQVLMTSNPIAADELGEEGLVEHARTHGLPTGSFSSRLPFVNHFRRIAVAPLGDSKWR